MKSGVSKDADPYLPAAAFFASSSAMIFAPKAMAFFGEDVLDVGGILVAGLAGQDEGRAAFRRRHHIVVLGAGTTCRAARPGR